MVEELASRPPAAVSADSVWRSGGGDWAGAAVSQRLGPTAALTCSMAKHFQGSRFVIMLVRP